jgi:PAS domain S-box-containing protein
MSEQSLKILMIEDNPGDIVLLKEILRETGCDLSKLVSVSYLSEGLRRLSTESFDAILLDLSLPDSQGLETLTRTYQCAPEIPIIVLTSLDDEETAVESAQAGAEDYLIKGKIGPSSLGRTLRYAVGRKQAELGTKESEERYRRLFQTIPTGVYQCTADWRILSANPALANMLGYETVEALLQQELDWQKIVGSREDFVAVMEREGQVVGLESAWRCKDGSTVYVWESAKAIRGDLGQIVQYEGIVEDITRHKEAEAALVAQKQLFENLVAVARATTERPTLEGTLLKTLEVAVRLSEADLGSLFLLDGSGNVTHSLLVRGGTAPWQQAGSLERISQIMEKGLAGWVTRRRKTALVDDLLQDERWLQLPSGPYKARSALAVPITRQNSLLGILTLTHSKPAHFGTDLAQLMEAAVDQMALALHNARIYEDQRRLTAYQTTLYEVIRTIGEHLDPETVVHAAVTAIAQFTNWPGVEIVLPNEDETQLVIWATAGTTSIHEGRAYPTDQGIAGRAFQTGQTQYVPDVGRDPDYWERHTAICCELAVPLRRGKRILGILNVGSDLPDGFEPDDIRLAESLAEATALALDNARLYAAAQQELLDRKRAEQALRESEVKHRLLLNSIRTPVLALRDDMTILYCNDAYAAFVDKAASEMEGKNLLDLFPEVELSVSYAAYQRVLETGEPNEVEGSIRDRHWNSRIYRTPWGILSIAEDVTQRRQAEAQLRLQSSALAAAANGIVIVNREGKIIWANPAFTQLTGYSVEEVIGQNPRILKSGQHDEAFYQEMWETILSGQVWRHELSNKRKDGTLYVEEMTITPVRDTEGEVSHFIAIKQDVTERKQAENELRRAKEAAEVASRAKSTFLANMSHELRTPLNAIIGYSELLEDEFRDLGYDSFIPDVEKIQGAGKQLLTIINDVLDLSKIEAGRMELSLETFIVSAMIDSLVSRVYHQVERNGNTLKVQMDDDLGTMYGDTAKVRQILLNLLSNAAKFTERGTITLVASRKRRDDAEWCVFEVHDTGIGMNPEQMMNLFQPFTQADGSASRRYGGSGLGLAISRRFCQMMGGEISVQSEWGRGSTFTVQLPTVVTYSNIDLGSGSQAVDLVIEESNSAPLPRTMGTILVIDDDAAACELIARTLNRAGFHVVTAQNGEDGLELAERIHPHVITLDVLMPEMDGWTVLARLKATPDLADIPVIMVSFLDEKGRGIALGAADYLVKPIDGKRLIELVRRCQYGDNRDHILVVEDDPTTRKILRIMLEQEGWSVSTAPDGQIALETIKEKIPDLILLDLIMPQMDGFEFLEALRQLPQGLAVPVLVITGKQLTAQDFRRLSGNVEEILQKGAYSIDELLRQVCELATGCLKGNVE